MSGPIAREIERKFLVDINKLPNLENNPSYEIAQGYLSTDPVVRIRISKKTNNDHHFYSTPSGFITIKGPGLGNHLEFETRIDYSNALELMTLCKSVMKKKRFILPVQNDKKLNWEIDFFEDENSGLVVAEIELPKEDYPFEKPEWCLEEVTMDSRYTNSNISKTPFNTWK